MSRHASNPGTATGSRAADMRLEFDSAFARLPRPAESDLTDVLAVRVGDEPCVLRLGDVAGVIARPVITAVPTPVPALLGITAGRGSPVAAYDLGLLLGREQVTPRWLVLAAAEPGIGIVFEHFDGYRRISLGPDRSQHVVEMQTLIDLITTLTHNHHRSNQEIDS